MTLAVERRRRALGALVLTCALWSLSFPVMKTLGLHVAARAPEVSSWFVAAGSLVVRFGLGALLLGSLRPTRPTPSEWRQGAWLGVFAGSGMLFQMDALSFTSASTSAFLTQGYIVILPVVAAVGARKAPEVRIVLCVLTIALGLFLLSRFDLRQLHLGRGEGETLLAAGCFSLQILWLDKSAYRGNRTRVVSVVMFACIALLLLPVVAWSAHGWADVGLLLGSPVAACLLFLLTIPSTVIAFSLMNRFQPDLSASEAGIVYGAEPVFASLLALFLPAILGRMAHVFYDNERLTLRLLVGGALIISANVLLQLPASARAKSLAE